MTETNWEWPEGYEKDKDEALSNLYVELVKIQQRLKKLEDKVNG